MKLLLKTGVFVIVFIPVFVLTSVIWLAGGWTKGFDYMPNPAYWLFDWVERD